MEKIVRTYELTYVIPGSYTDNDAAQVKSEIEQLLKKHKAEVVSTEDWGRRPLAYTIAREGKKHTEGLFTHLVLKMDADKASPLDRDMFLSNKVIRHLLLVVDPVEAPVETK